MRKKHALALARRRRTRTATALAAVGALLAGIGVVGLMVPAASANSITCDSLGYAKFDTESGSQSLVDGVTAVGTMVWSGKTLNYTVENGYTVRFCIKSGSQAGTTEFTVVGPAAGSKAISQGISHVGWRLLSTGPSQPAALVDSDEEEELNCEQGYRSRVVTTTKDYVLIDDRWVLEPESGWVVAPGQWSDWRALTTAERAQLNCDRPTAIIENIADSEMSCALGYRSRTGTITKEYVRSESGWALEPSAEWATTWGTWSAYRGLTDTEFEQLGCRPGQPQPVELLGSEERVSCAGVESRESSQVTTFAWNASTRQYDKVEGPVVWGDWTKVRGLSADELLERGCVLGEETLLPKPTKDPKPDGEPTVKGADRVVPAAVPTAVEAGAVGPASNTTQMMAQMLVGGGLLLLLAGGWIGLGRRETGAHEA